MRIEEAIKKMSDAYGVSPDNIVEGSDIVGDLVHDVSASNAHDINNSGLESQIEFLLGVEIDDDQSSSDVKKVVSDTAGMTNQSKEKTQIELIREHAPDHAIEFDIVDGVAFLDCTKCGRIITFGEINGR